MALKVVGIPKLKYDKNWSDSLTDIQKNEVALSDDNSLIFDDIKSFEGDLNDGAVCGLTMYNFYFINV